MPLRIILGYETMAQLAFNVGRREVVMTLAFLMPPTVEDSNYGDKDYCEGTRVVIEAGNCTPSRIAVKTARTFGSDPVV